MGCQTHSSSWLPLIAHTLHLSFHTFQRNITGSDCLSSGTNIEKPHLMCPFLCFIYAKRSISSIPKLFTCTLLLHQIQDSCDFYINPALHLQLMPLSLPCPMFHMSKPYIKNKEQKISKALYYQLIFSKQNPYIQSNCVHTWKSYYKTNKSTQVFCIVQEMNT